MNIRSLYATIGRRCRHARESHKLTLKQVGDRLGMTPQAVSLFEKGKIGSSELLVYYVVYMGVRLEGINFIDSLEG